MNFLKANAPFAISALVILTGYLLKRLRILNEDDGETLARIAINVTLPAVILLNIPFLPLTGSNAVLPLFSLVSSGIIVVLGLMLFRDRTSLQKGFALSSSSGYNIGLFAIPMVSGVYGPEGIARFALIDVGNAVAIFVLAYYLAYFFSPHRKAGGGSVKEILAMFLRSIPFLCYLIAITMNLTGLRISGAFADYIGILAAMNRGIALLTLGILLRFRIPGEIRKIIMPPMVLRYGFGILAGAIILLFFPMPLENRIAVASVLIMPMGLTIVPFSVKWGYDRNAAAAVINAGIPISFLLFWAIWLTGRQMGA